MLFFGVVLFSVVLEQFLEMINKIKEFHKTFDEGDSLARFFGVLEKFNNNKPLELELRSKIEKHFDYKW